MSRKQISLYNVMTKQKDVLINIRINEEVRDQFKIACELRGQSMSGLLHQYIYRVIREEKAISPKSFLSEPETVKLDKISPPVKKKKTG